MNDEYVKPTYLIGLVAYMIFNIVHIYLFDKKMALEFIVFLDRTNYPTSQVKIIRCYIVTIY